MLTLCGGQVECLWDEVLPIKARELPEDLARLDAVLSDPLLLQPIAAAWERARVVVAALRSRWRASCA